MFTTILGKYCYRNKDWEKTLSASPYNLKIKHDGEYIIFSYNQLESDFSDPIVQEARGIIFKEGYWEYPVCRAFDKFFNYGETNAADIDWNTARVTEKIDGSLMKLWYDNNEWHISTNGTIDAFKAEVQDINVNSFGELFLRYFENNNIDFTNFTNNLNTDFTYLFELVSPYTRVVIPYDSIDLYYLGCRMNKEPGQLFSFHETSLSYSVMDYKIKTPKIYLLFSFEDCIKATLDLPWDEEGYVVDDANGNRIKIKSPAYVMAHHSRSNGCVSKETLIDVVLKNECEEFLTYADDYKSNIEEIKNDMNKLIELHKYYAEQQINNLDKWTNRKEYAMWVKSCPEIVQPYLFKLFDQSLNIYDYIKDWNSKKWERMLDRTK